MSMQRRPLSELKMFIVHHTDTKEDKTVQDIRLISQGQGDADVAYHWLVGIRGAKQGRPIKYRGAHAEGEKWNKARERQGLSLGDLNSVSIGITLIGSFVDKDPNPKLISDTADAIKRVGERFGIPLNRATVKGHNVVDWTACPGRNTMRLLYARLGI